MHIPITTPDTSARRRIATIGALALTVLGLNVSPASAGSDEHINTDGGSAHFYASGTEQLFVSDIRADGEGVRAQLRWNGGVVSVNDFDGAGNGFEHQKLVLPERTDVELRLCYTNNGQNLQCTGWQRAEA
jgi:hypothetical protein